MHPIYFATIVGPGVLAYKYAQGDITTDFSHSANQQQCMWALVAYIGYGLPVRCCRGLLPRCTAAA